MPGIAGASWINRSRVPYGLSGDQILRHPLWYCSGKQPHLEQREVALCWTDTMIDVGMAEVVVIGGAAILLLGRW